MVDRTRRRRRRVTLSSDGDKSPPPALHYRCNLALAPGETDNNTRLDRFALFSSDVDFFLCVFSWLRFLGEKSLLYIEPLLVNRDG